MIKTYTERNNIKCWNVKYAADFFFHYNIHMNAVRFIFVGMTDSVLIIKTLIINELHSLSKYSLNSIAAY